MSPLVVLRIALAALARNKLRAGLTMLGIVIGVAAVITMVAVGRGAQTRVEEQIRLLGANTILVTPGSQLTVGARVGAASQQTLTEDDAAALAREVPEVQYAAPTVRTWGTQVIAGNLNWATSVFGTTNDYLAARDWPVASGRSFDAAEQASAAKVVILGETVAQQLFGDADPLDRYVRVRTTPAKVIGVLERKGYNAYGQDQDDLVVMPIATVRNRVQGQSNGRLRRVGSITVKARDGEPIAAAIDNMRQLLRQRHRLQPGQEDDFTVRNLAEVLEAQEASSRVLTLLLAAVAGVSLLVGGIGIMNIMLVSVTERTREIGLRMAVGARGRDILGQFLAEATTLSLIGGAIGVAAGVATAIAVGQAAGWRTPLSIDAMIVAVVFAAAIGVFFGWYPARKASRLQPIEALRYE